MNPKDLKEEKHLIFEVARVDRYGRRLIKKLIDKQKRKMHVNKSRTKNRWIKLTYYPPITNQLTQALRSADIEPAFVSGNKIKHRFCNNKDKIEECRKSGVYRMKSESCDDGYSAVKARGNVHKCDVRDKTQENAIALHYDQNEMLTLFAKQITLLIIES